ncbi:MAG: YitT family protein [Bacilli bacterium]|nr:YitT family protein [Bacilli bacterium]
MKFFMNQKLQKIKERVENKSKIKRYVQFCIGCFLVAAAFNLFLSSNDLVPGGVSGFSIILDHLFHINKSLVILIASLILLVMSYFLLGREKTRDSILGSLLFPLFVEVTSHIGNYITIDTSQLLLSAIFGGVVYGFGAGMIFKAGFTTGGTDILNQIMSKYLKISMGKSMIFCDGTIVILSGLVFGPTKLMYSIIILYLISYMSDRVILGISDSKAFYIVTDEEKRIKEYIIKYLNHGVTVFNAKGGYKKERQTVLLCVLPTKEYYRLKEGIHEIDPDAFFVVTDAYEVFGGE